MTSPSGSVKAGDCLELKSAKSVAAKEAYFITSMGPVSAPLQGSGTDYKVTVPAGAQKGQEYLVLTSGGVPTDDNTVAGPAVVQIQDNAYGQPAGHWEGGWGGYGNGNKGGKWGKKGGKYEGHH